MDGYRRSSLHLVPILLCAAIDLQGDVRKAVKVAFDAKGSGYVVDWTITLTLQDAVDWCNEPVPCGPEGEEHLVTAALIDEGHQVKKVRLTCLANLLVFWPVKGRSGVQVRELISTSIHYVEGQEILAYHVAEDQFKWQLLKMITEFKKKKLDQPVMHFPEDVEEEEDFMDEMCAEQPVKATNKFGKEKWEWKKVGKANDFWDCVKYCLCIRAVKRVHFVAEGKAE